MSEYRPDKWVLVKIPFPDASLETKVLGGWSGGYLDSDSWRLSSGVTKIKDLGESWEITNVSGSVYFCYKNSEGTTFLSATILEKLIQDHGAECVKASVLG